MTIDYADKISKLLAKAEGTASREEAEAFQRRAEQLMVKWGIDDAHIRERKIHNGNAQSEVRADWISFTGVFSMEYINIANAVVKGIGQAECFYGSREKSHKVFTIVGFPSDIERAKMLIMSLELQAVNAMKTWWADHRKKRTFTAWEAHVAKREFFAGFGNSVYQRLLSIHQDAVQDAGEESTELVLRSQMETINDWIKEHVGDLGKATKKRQQDIAGFVHGSRAGDQADIGQSRIDQ